MNNKKTCIPLLTLEIIKKNNTEIKKFPFEKMADFYKALCDPTKLKILYILSKYKQLSVCDISAIINVNLSAVSHQLKKLKLMNLIKSEKTGRTVLYSLKDKKIIENIF